MSSDADKKSPAGDAAAPQRRRRLPTVPETILKKRRTVEELASRRKQEQAAENRAARKKKAAAEKPKFKFAEQLVKDARSLERKKMLLLRQEHRHPKEHEYVPAGPEGEERRLALVVRLRGLKRLPGPIARMLRIMKLTEINSAAFVVLSRNTLHMLHLCEPYVAWGFPDAEMIRELVTKRGFAKVGEERAPLNDNALIEKHLGEYGILCLEDIVHEIAAVGPHFRETQAFLWPFKLASPREGRLKVPKRELQRIRKLNREVKTKREDQADEDADKGKAEAPVDEVKKAALPTDERRDLTLPHDLLEECGFRSTGINGFVRHLM